MPKLRDRRATRITQCWLMMASTVISATSGAAQTTASKVSLATATLPWNMVTPPPMPTNTQDYPLITFTDILDLGGSNIVPDFSVIKANRAGTTWTGITYTADCSGYSICSGLYMYTFTQLPNMVAWQVPRAISNDGQVIMAPPTLPVYQSSIAWWTEECDFITSSLIGTCFGSFEPLTFNISSPLVTPAGWATSTALRPDVAAARVTAGIHRLGLAPVTTTIPVSTLTYPVVAPLTTCSLAQHGAGPPYVNCIDVTTQGLGTTSYPTSYPCQPTIVSGSTLLSCGSIYIPNTSVAGSPTGSSCTFTLIDGNPVYTCRATTPAIGSGVTTSFPISTTCTASTTGTWPVLVCRQYGTTKGQSGATHTITLGPSTTSATVYPRLTSIGYGFTYVVNSTAGSGGMQRRVSSSETYMSLGLAFIVAFLLSLL